jgi:hypothetical protein
MASLMNSGHQGVLDFILPFFNVEQYFGGEYPEKTTDLPKVTDKLYHIML